MHEPGIRRCDLAQPIIGRSVCLCRHGLGPVGPRLSRLTDPRLLDPHRQRFSIAASALAAVAATAPASSTTGLELPVAALAARLVKGADYSQSPRPTSDIGVFGDNRGRWASHRTSGVAERDDGHAMATQEQGRIGRGSPAPTRWTGGDR